MVFVCLELRALVAVFCRRHERLSPPFLLTVKVAYALVFFNAVLAELSGANAARNSPIFIKIDKFA